MSARRIRVWLWPVTLAGLFLTASCSEQLVPRGPEQQQTVPFVSLASLEVAMSSNPGPTLVEFSQDFNCPRCDQMAATMLDIRSGYSSDVTFHRVNYLAATGGSSRFPIGICPSYLFFRDGEVVGQLSGNQPYPILASWLNNLLAAEGQQAESQSENISRI